jgi:hypothetical protein
MRFFNLALSLASLASSTRIHKDVLRTQETLLTHQPAFSEMTDVVIRVYDGVLRAHSSILLAHSRYFSDVLLLQNPSEEVDFFHLATANTMNVVLKFCYTAEVEKEVELMPEKTYLAHYLGGSFLLHLISVPLLRDELYSRLNDGKIVDLFTLAMRMNDIDFAESIFRGKEQLIYSNLYRLDTDHFIIWASSFWERRYPDTMRLWRYVSRWAKRVDDRLAAYLIYEVLTALRNQGVGMPQVGWSLIISRFWNVNLKG